MGVGLIKNVHCFTDITLFLKFAQGRISKIFGLFEFELLELFYLVDKTCNRNCSMMTKNLYSKH